jgi:hypothetical protein
MESAPASSKRRQRMDFSHGQNLRTVSIRIPIDLHEQLTTEARAAVRTVSGECVFRLRRSFEPQVETDAD